MSNGNLPFSREDLEEYGLSPEHLAEIESTPHITPPDLEGEAGQPLLIDFIFDASGSMGGLYAALAEEFNTTMLSGLRGVNRRQSHMLRLGGLLFATGFSHIWPGFRSLDELGAAPLQTEMFRRPELGSQTALYRAMNRGLLWTKRYTAKFTEATGRPASGMVVVLTDGANNEVPLEATKVARKLAETRDSGCAIDPFFAYFKTGDGLSETAAEELAAATGFQMMCYHDITSMRGGTREQNFRHCLGLFSSQVIDAASRTRTMRAA